MTSAYDEDLAYIHDRGFGGLAEAAARRVVELLGRPSFVVELGCGSGASSRLLTEAGHDVLGIDASEAMLALARRNAPAATVRHGCLPDVEIPPCDAVTAIGEVLNYVEGDAGELVRRVHTALRPGGVFVLDVAGPGRVPGDGPERRWTASDDWAVLVEAEEAAGTLTRRITTFRDAGGGLHRRATVVHRQRLYPASEVLTLLRAAGFRARTLRGYGGRPVAPGHRAFVARRGATAPQG